MGPGRDTRNLLGLKPLRNLEWEQGENDNVVLLIPRFRGRTLGDWLNAHLKKPYVRLKLDESGSFVWNRCDGVSTVHAIADSMRKAFGSEFDPGYERIGTFIRYLVKNDFVTLRE